MSGGRAPRWRAGLAAPVLFALLAAVTFVGLGTWQVHRKDWKEGLIEALEQRLSAPPVVLPPRERWAGLEQSDEEFRRVRLEAEFQTAREAFVYAGGSALRPSSFFKSDMTPPAAGQKLPPALSVNT